MRVSVVKNCVRPLNEFFFLSCTGLHRTFHPIVELEDVCVRYTKLENVMV